MAGVGLTLEGEPGPVAGPWELEGRPCTLCAQLAVTLTREAARMTLGAGSRHGTDSTPGVVGRARLRAGAGQGVGVQFSLFLLALLTWAPGLCPASH